MRLTEMKLKPAACPKNETNVHYLGEIFPVLGLMSLSGSLLPTAEP